MLCFLLCAAASVGVVAILITCSSRREHARAEELASVVRLMLGRHDSLDEPGRIAIVRAAAIRYFDLESDRSEFARACRLRDRADEQLCCCGADCDCPCHYLEPEACSGCSS